MGRSADTSREALLTQARSAAKAAYDGLDGDVAVRFMEQFLRAVPPDDLEGANPGHMIGAGLSLFSLMGTRARGKSKLRTVSLPGPGGQDVTVVETVNQDMAFLVDSLTSALAAAELPAQMLIHPIMPVVRDGRGKLKDVLAPDQAVSSVAPELRPQLESVIHVRIPPLVDKETKRVLEQRLTTMLEALRAANEDWGPMRDAASAIIKDLTIPVVGIAPDDQNESRDFLQWLRDDHFTFLGYRDYVLSDTGIDMVPHSGLGILHDASMVVLEELSSQRAITSEMALFLKEPTVLLVTKSNQRSPVRRHVPLDLVGVKRFDPEGRVVGMRLFCGLFTAELYKDRPTFVPLLRRKVARVIERAGFPPRSHDGKRLYVIVENLPREELFQTDDDQLFDLAMGILHLQERQKVAVFTRVDKFERFVSFLIFVPRDRFDTKLRQAIQAFLAACYNGEVTAYFTHITDAPLARLNVYVQTTPGAVPDVDPSALEAQITELARSWSDNLVEDLREAHGERQGRRLAKRYADAFPVAYRDRFDTREALADIDLMEEAIVSAEGLSQHLDRPDDAGPDDFRFKLLTLREPMPLSDIIPILEHMGFHVIGEEPYRIMPVGSDEAVWLHDFSMRADEGHTIDVEAVRCNVHEAFAGIWVGAMEDDRFNMLVLRAGLHWREVTVLRAYAKFLKQAALPYSERYVVDALVQHPDIVRALIALFHARLDPDRKDHDGAHALATVEALLDAVSNADQDRILRRYVNLIMNTLRTNHYQTGADGGPKPVLALKLDSRNVEGLPAPRPWREMFVYSPRVEAVHLRGGAVARGGIRWSDRREDFRTEILGLVKAQMVKNAVIVPVGAKGGFVVKQPPADPSREAQQAEGIACYRMFMGGLLDVVDNMKGGKVIHPPRVVRHDDDDPYLVVAADKGTATFSDIANGVAQDYGFWLDDAFASGGSVGYDHKAMGITARGAWEAVKRHFREIGINTQTDTFTAIGVGDMAGDVFGNGLLRTETVKLVAAFNHMHIFVDPDPDPAASFQERKRLFETPRSTWADYDAKLISKGGGVFERKAKNITLSPDIQTLLGITEATVTPNTLIQAILKAQVDLLWFGGIGTYIKAKTESHADVGDRANDAIRVNGSQIRARVIGEGANLGATQLGRIELALAGGRLNTDAIDNSAGVDCSDHEVNIKILLNAVTEQGGLTLPKRNKLLERMTDEVGALVLRHNYGQTLALTVMEAQGADMLDEQERFMRFLEREGRLDRALEFLPTEDVVAERRAKGKALTRPELSVLLPYAKMWVYDSILASDLPDDPILTVELDRYFPGPIVKHHQDAMAAHPLRREIIATMAANNMVNRMSGAFILMLMDKTGMPVVDVARAFLIVREAFGLRGLWDAVNALDNVVAADVQTAMLQEIMRTVHRASLWLLRHGARPLPVTETVQSLGGVIQTLEQKLDDLISPDVRESLHARVEAHVAQGVPEDTAQAVARLVVLAAATDVGMVAQEEGVSVPTVAKLYYALGAAYDIRWIRNATETVQPNSHWEKQALSALMEDMYAHQRELARAIVRSNKGKIRDTEAAMARWEQDNAVVCDRAHQMVAELRAAGTLDMAMITVASRHFRAMAGG